MKVTIPENISDINLWQFQRYDELIKQDLDDYSFNIRKINIFTDIPIRDVKNISQVDFEKLLKQIDVSLSTDIPFQSTFTIDEIKFGLIPNFDKISIGEFADLSKYGMDVENLHYVMAILFRPIINENKKNEYEIMNYQGTEEFADLMRKTPLNIVNSSLVFFWNLANELRTATQKYLTEELVRDMNPKITSRTSDGTQQLKNWLKITFLKSAK
jgi:hypothetical protein